MSLAFLSLLTASPELAHSQAREETNVVYGMHYGTALLMDVAYPDSANGYGVIFIPGSAWHAEGGYGTTALKDREDARYMEKALTRAGYTVFTINHRAAPRFTYPAAVEDAKRAVRFIRDHAERFEVTRNPFGAVGASSGGHLVSMLGVLEADSSKKGQSVRGRSAKVQCVAAFYAPQNLFTAGRDAPRDPLPNFLGHPRPTEGGESSEVYREASPITYVSEDDASFLLIHGEDDQEVGVEQSAQMRDSLAQAGVPVELLTLPGRGHAFVASKEFDHYGHLTPWFEQCLSSRSSGEPDSKETQ